MQIETRNDKTREISGYGILFNDKSKILRDRKGEEFIEVIHPEALNNLDLGDVYLYYQHDPKQVLASTEAGTLNLQITQRGLYFTANLPETRLGQDTYELLKRGDLKDMSFGFTVQKDSWDVTQNPPIRKVQQIGNLDEISIVTRGAYKNTSIEVCRFKCHRQTNPLTLEARSLLESIQTNKES